MAHSFSITDGTSSFSLTSTNSMLTKYDMSGGSDGGEETVTDTVEILIYASTPALMQAAKRSLGALLTAAQRRQERQTGARVYVRAQLDSDTVQWQSEIVGGRLELMEDSLAVWANKMFEARLHIKRKPYWEEVNWRAIGLTNGNGSDTTSGITVYTTTDGYGTAPNKCEGYAYWGSDDFSGDLDAALKVELTNAKGSTIQFDTIWLAVNNENDPSGFDHVWEGEDAVSGGSSVSNPADSYGNYRTLTTTTGTMQWTITAAQAQDMAGHPFRFIVAQDLQPTGSGFLQLQIRDSVGNRVLAYGDKVFVSVSSYPVLDMGILFVPPTPYTADPGACRLVLACSFSTSTTIRIDAIHVLPAYTARKLYAPTTSDISTTGTVVLDESEGRAYQIEGGDEQHVWTLQGAPALARPGVAGRLFFTGYSWTQWLPRADKFTLKVWGKNRRTSI